MEISIGNKMAPSDPEKAFDTDPNQQIWNRLIARGVNTHLCKSVVTKT